MPYLTLKKELTSKDISNFVGFPVQLLDQSQFTGWDIMMQGDKPGLTQQVNRAKEIEAAIYALGSPLSDFSSESKKPFDFSEVHNASRSVFPIVSFTGRVLDEVDRNARVHFEKVIEKGADAVVNPSSGTGSHYNFPGAFSEEEINTEEVIRPNLAFILTYGPSVDVRECWSLATAIPVDQLSHAPDDGYLRTAYTLHETGHLLQEYGKSKILNRGRDLGTDMFANSVLRQGGDETKQTRDGWMHARYLDLLTAADEMYWFAPTMKALESENVVTRKQAPTFEVVSRSVTEIHRHLVMEKERIDHSSKVDGLNKVYDAWTQGFRKNRIAEQMFPLLDAIVNKGILEDTQTRQIAGDILKAANFFAPELVANRPKGVAVKEPSLQLAD